MNTLYKKAKGFKNIFGDSFAFTAFIMKWCVVMISIINVFYY